MDRFKLPLLAVLVFSLVVGLSAAYFFLHVEPRREYMIELELRRLDAIADRIDAQIADYRQLVGNGGTAPRLEMIEPELPPKPASRKPAIVKEDFAADGRWFVFYDSDVPRARVRAGDVVEPALEKHQFDKLILANAKGLILHQTGRGDLQLRTLAALDGLDKDGLERISRSTGTHDVEVSGRKYKLFFQPLEGDWVLCGLMRTRALQMESFRIPADVIILLVGGLLLALLALPFLKLVTIGREERLRSIDGLLAALCALIGVSVLSILLLDRIVYKQLNRVADGQLERLAGRVHEDLTRELASAREDLASLNEQALKADATAQAAGRLPEDSRHVDFFWAGSDGIQRFKWTPRGQETSKISVWKREYFQDALTGRLLPGGFAIQPIRSWTTGKDMDEIAVPVRDRDGREAVAVLSTVLASVHRPVLPPGFGFAVIEPAGRVLFHSDPKRALQENFLEETESRELEALLFAERRDSIKVRYLGRQHQIYTMPMEGLPWTIVTFRDLTLLRAIHVQIVTVALACLVLYAGLFLLLFSLVYLLSSTRARWIWPSDPRRGTYVQLAMVYACCLLAYLAPLFTGDPVFLLVNGMLVPLLALFVSYVKVRSDEGLRDDKQRMAVTVALAALSLVVAVGAWRLLPERPRVLAFSVAALAVGALFLFLPAITGFFQRHRSMMPLRGVYLASATLLLMVLTVLPAVSFFKLARDLPFENLVKHGQLRMFQQLAGRGESRDLPLGDYSTVFFATDRKPCKGSRCAQEPLPDPHLAWLVALQEDSFPIYNEHSREMARLAFDERDGWPWRWHHLAGGRLRLHGNQGSEKGTIHLSSSLPPPGFEKRDWKWLAVGVIVLALVSFGIAGFLSRNLLLLRAGSPLWMSRRRLSSLGIGSPSGLSKDAAALEESLCQARVRLLGEQRPWVEGLVWRRQVDRCLDLVRRECGPTAPLQEIGRGLLSDLGPEELDRDGLLDEIERLAESHYESLWASITEPERVVLLQLAEEGLVNPKNIQPLERLIARGLVLCDPAPRLMNESFRCHITCTSPRHEVSKREQESGRYSLWGRLQRPLYATLLGLVLFFGFTQKEALDSTIALVAAVAGGLPHVLKLVGLVGLSKTGGTPGG